ncbi:MAG: L,D-transpeptidase ErfK/SrfK [Gaiellaceae bacterium]|nr:L,D-transpeptidase ErfK/SrfK [Gaiellaceae bacterium]
MSGIALTGGSAYAYFWDSSRSDVIAKGVQIAGVDVGGLRAGEARALLDARLAERLRQPVRLAYGERRFTVRPTSAGISVDVARMVDGAVQASRQGDLAHRVLRDLRGRRLEASIPIQAGLSTARVAQLVDNVARVIDRPARNARVFPKPLATGLRIIPSRPGLAVKRPQLAQRLTSALLRFDAPGTVAVPTRAVHPRWWTSTLKRRYHTYILVSRETFTLRLYKHLKLSKTYRIAVGQAGLETPAGEYTINDKQVDPWWHVPNSAWAGALAGRVIPPGPEDPIKARWMGFYNGAGIHGTVEDWSIGTAASHGCIRMTIPDVEDLYERVPLNTPIYVG